MAQPSSQPITGLSEEIEREIQEELAELLAPQGIQTDWKAYYDRFDAAHGGYPVRFKGKLLWADGWTYAMDHAGPEWPPPGDPKELKEYQVAYWSKRRAVLFNEVRRFKDDIQNLRQTQAAKNVPLQRVVRKPGTNAEGLSIMRVEYEDLDFEILDEKLGWMEKDLSEMDSKVKELNNV